MIPALWISKTGLDAQQTNISVTSNNLANASTVGFKRGRAVFEDLLYQKINQPGGRSSADSYLPEGLMIGAGAKVVATVGSEVKGDKIKVYKFHRRKGYRRTQGHREQYTLITINKIEG